MSAVVTPDTLTPAASLNSKVIVIIGAGFSGTVLAIQLLRRALTTPTKVVLIERNGTAGRGIAYATNNYPYLLNVPAGRMSINSQDPLEFLHFAQRKLPAVGARDFLPRALYGEYLQEVLRDAVQTTPVHVSLELVQADVQQLDAATASAPLRVELSNGITLHAHDIVLATGNPPPATLPGADELAQHPAYVGNPWCVSRNFTAEHSVLIVGTGLTMVDVVMKLTDDELNTPTVHAISRRGLVPLSHASSGNSQDSLKEEFDALLWSATSVRRLLRATRRLAHSLDERGSNWREVIVYLRQIAPRLWQRLPAAERRRFTRHLQCYWDICRHLLPTAVRDHLQFVREQHKLHILAGRIQAMQAEGERIRVSWRARGHSQTQSAVFDAVINATGPDFNVQRSRDPLLRSLYEGGSIAADPLGLGIRTGANGAVIDQQGKRHPHLFYLGPLLRANDWETTAAPELFRYAEQLGEHLSHQDSSLA